MSRTFPVEFPKEDKMVAFSFAVNRSETVKRSVKLTVSFPVELGALRKTTLAACAVTPISSIRTMDASDDLTSTTFGRGSVVVVVVPFVVVDVVPFVVVVVVPAVEVDVSVEVAAVAVEVPVDVVELVDAVVDGTVEDLEVFLVPRTTPTVTPAITQPPIATPM
jgi:hypothetical protein